MIAEKQISIQSFTYYIIHCYTLEKDFFITRITTYNHPPPIQN